MDVADGEEDGQDSKPAGPAWEGSDRDYMYEELLGMLPYQHIVVQCCSNKFPQGITLAGSHVLSVMNIAM